MSRNRRKPSEPELEPKKVEEQKVQTLVQDEETPTNNPVLLRNRYDKAMKEVHDILSSEKKLKEYLAQKTFKFKFVGIGGSLRFINEGKFMIASLENPNIDTKDKDVALMLLKSEKFKIVK